MAQPQRIIFRCSQTVERASPGSILRNKGVDHVFRGDRAAITPCLNPSPLIDGWQCLGWICVIQAVVGLLWKSGIQDFRIWDLGILGLGVKTNSDDGVHWLPGRVFGGKFSMYLFKNTCIDVFGVKHITVGAIFKLIQIDPTEGQVLTPGWHENTITPH